MYEIEGMQCEQIARLLAIPVGTVYSRLYLARRDFEAAMMRFEARERRGRGGL
jgi:RNA polymerase sigma-70 factor (ECF subfamily)